MEAMMTTRAKTRLDIKTEKTLADEKFESVPNCPCTVCKLYPVTQKEYDSLH